MRLAVASISSHAMGLSRMIQHPVYSLPSCYANVVVPVQFSVALNQTSLLSSGAKVFRRAATRQRNASARKWPTKFCNHDGILITKRGPRAIRNNLHEDKEENSESGDSDPDKFRKSDSFIGWSVPWDGRTVVVTMITFGLSFLLTGVSLSVAFARLGFGRRQGLELDEQAILIFTNQLLQTVVGISVINICISSYRPLPNDFFSYDWRNPFDIRSGWLLWGVVGLFLGAAAVLCAGTLTSILNGQPLPREEQDALLQLLPLIGASKTSTALLVAVTGILAPYLEETVFRGFLMTSLTKWMPTSTAVILSASAFAFAHLTPGEVPQLFALGVVLGFSYAKSRNLLTPIMIHAFWNSGVVLLLTYLRLQGYDIQEII